MINRATLFMFLGFAFTSRLSADSDAAAPSPAARPATAEIDFGKPAGPVTARASGFLLSVGNTSPPDNMIAPLKPQLFRDDVYGYAHHPDSGEGMLEVYPRLYAMGVRHFQFVLSDDLRYDQMRESDKWPGDHGDWSEWETLVTANVKAVQAAGDTIEYDIWNEPDSRTFWDRSWDQFLELYARTYRLIRQLDPKAQIIGPNIAWFEEGKMKSFFLYAKANQVLPDIVAWHENASEGVPYNRIVERVAFVKKLLRENNIPIDRFSINEFAGEFVHSNPGAIVGYMSALEKAKVESAARSCWEERAALYNGKNCSLDGLLTDPDKQPRATWWVYKAYADLTGMLAETKTSDAVNALASFDPATKSAHILLGRFHGGIGPERKTALEGLDPAVAALGHTTTGTGPLRVTLKGLDQLGVAKGAALHISAGLIPETGWTALPAPQPIFDRTVTPQGGTVEFELDGVGKNDACVIDVRPAP